jgi:hypothetical protein
MSAGPRAYATYFDERYLALAIVMLRSLRRYDPGALVFVLGFDAPSRAAVGALDDPGIVTLSPDDLVAFEPRLRDCAGRARGAFYATHKPVLPLLALARRPDIRAIVHVDADCCFFASPAPLFDEIGDASVALSPHDFSPVFEELAVCGRFNAGFIYWRHDETGVRCLHDYREDCLAWCEPRVEPDGRFMNQGYLVRWPDRYPGVHVIGHPGVNLAYWNIARRSLYGVWRVMVDGVPLVCYHFSGLFLDEAGVWRNARREFGANLEFAVARIYAPFLKDVDRADRWLRQINPELGPIDTGWLKDGEPVGHRPAADDAAL